MKIFFGASRSNTRTRIPAARTAPLKLLAAALVLALAATACGGPAYVHPQYADSRYDDDRFNCEWELKQQNPDIDGDELDKGVDKCLKDLGWTVKEKPKDDDGGWWPF